MGPLPGDQIGYMLKKLIIKITPIGEILMGLKTAPIFVPGFQLQIMVMNLNGWIDITTPKELTLHRF